MLSDTLSRIQFTLYNVWPFWYDLWPFFAMAVGSLDVDELIMPVTHAQTIWWCFIEELLPLLSSAHSVCDFF